MRLGLVVSAVLLGLAGTVVPPILTLGPLTWFALAAAGWTASVLVVARSWQPTSSGWVPVVWPRTTVGSWALTWTAGAAVTLAFDSPVVAAVLLVAAPAGLHVLVTAADTVALAHPVDVARPSDVERMMRFDPRAEESEAAAAGLAAGMVVATLTWIGAVLSAGLQLVGPWSSVYVGVVTGALVAAVRAGRCLPAALRLQYAVTHGHHADHVRLLRAARRRQETTLPPDLAAVLPLWAARALAVSAIARITGPPGLVAVVALGGLPLLALWPTLLTVLVLVVVLVAGLAVAPRSRRRHDALLVRVAVPPAPGAGPA